ncbi:MAG: hypothetical protein Q4B28_06915 [bacterium]|nr:hypothetical protein [bacterium]
MKAENELLKQDKENLSKQVEELEAKQKHYDSRRVLIASKPQVNRETLAKTGEQVKASIKKLL